MSKDDISLSTVTKMKGEEFSSLDVVNKNATHDAYLSIVHRVHRHSYLLLQYLVLFHWIVVRLSVIISHTMLIRKALWLPLLSLAQVQVGIAIGFWDSKNNDKDGSGSEDKPTPSDGTVDYGVDMVRCLNS